MEDYNPFKIVSVLQGATTSNIDSVYDAAKYLLEKWPDEEHGPKYHMQGDTAKVSGGELLGCCGPRGIHRGGKRSGYLH